MTQVAERQNVFNRILFITSLHNTDFDETYFISQVKNHLVNICKYTSLHVAVLVGGMAIQKQLRVLSKCPDIVVATPGRLWEIIDSSKSMLDKPSSILFTRLGSLKLNSNHYYQSENNFFRDISDRIISLISFHVKVICERGCAVKQMT